ncbi:MAG TPA: hypothetical protein DCM71_06475 [Runella sp.]|nr:hypothetical protein [Runella sp.]
MYLVVNEWLPEYFLRKASDGEKKQLEQFLNRFLQRGDVLYVQTGSPFEAKIYKFAKDNQQFPTYQYFKQFIGAVLRNSKRCVLVEKNKSIPDEIDKRLNELGTNYNSDRYLFETAWQIPDNEPKIIITSDLKLKRQMEGNGYFDVLMLADFLKSY